MQLQKIFQPMCGFRQFSVDGRWLGVGGDSNKIQYFSSPKIFINLLLIKTVNYILEFVQVEMFCQESWLRSWSNKPVCTPRIPKCVWDMDDRVANVVAVHDDLLTQ